MGAIAAFATYTDLDGNRGICRQTRHTFARWVSESTGSIIETQDALGHKHAATTRVYVQRVAVKKDKHNDRELGLCKAQQASCQVHQIEKRHLVEGPLNVPHVVIAAKPKECYNSAERSATMVTVQLSKDEKLILPESLGRSLGLREGDRVEVRRQDDVLWLQRKEMSDALGPLTDLSRIVSSSRPVGSVDVEKIMDKHGYEQIDERSDL